MTGRSPSRPRCDEEPGARPEEEEEEDGMEGYARADGRTDGRTDVMGGGRGNVRRARGSCSRQVREQSDPAAAAQPPGFRLTDRRGWAGERRGKRQRCGRTEAAEELKKPREPTERHQMSCGMALGSGCVCVCVWRGCIRRVLVLP